MTLSLRPTNYSSRWKILIQIILKLINKNRCIWKIKTVKIDKKYYKWIPARVATTTNYICLLQLQLLNSVDVASTRSTICDELRKKVETTLQQITPALLAALDWCWRNLEELLNEPLAALTKDEVVVLSHYVLWDNLSVGISGHDPSFY